MKENVNASKFIKEINIIVVEKDLFGAQHHQAQGSTTTLRSGSARRPINGSAQYLSSSGSAKNNLH